MNEVIRSIIEGIIQGAAELLPVSSTGHILLFSSLSHGAITLTEIGLLHLSTVATIAIVMRDKLKEYLNLKVLINVIISIIPAGIAAFLFQDQIEKYLDSPTIIIASLIFWGVVLILVDLLAVQKMTAKITGPRITQLSEIRPAQAVLVSFSQLLALIPGTSRSGITTIFGIISGMNPKTAVEFSFMSGIPLTGAAGLYSLLKIAAGSQGTQFSGTLILLAMGIAFITGLGAAFILRKYIGKKILTICGVYRILLGTAILLAIIL